MRRIDERTLEKRKHKNNKSMVNETKQTIYKNKTMTTRVN